MRKSNRILAALLLAALPLFMLTSCGSGGRPSSDPSLPEPAASAESGPADLDVSGVDFSQPDIVISYGDYDGMAKLSKSIQNYEMEGVVVEIDGEMGMSMMSHTVVMPNADRSQSIGTTFQVIGMEDRDYPGEDTRVHLVGIVRPLSEYVQGIVVPKEYFTAEPIDGLNPLAVESDLFPGDWENWGRFTLLVPEGMSLRAGEQDGEVLPDVMWLESDDNPAHYYLFTLVDEETARKSVEAAREAHPGAETVTLRENGGWTGCAYRYLDTADCFEMYGEVNGQCVLVSAMWFHWDDETTHAVLDSLEIGEE